MYYHRRFILVTKIENIHNSYSWMKLNLQIFFLSANFIIIWYPFISTSLSFTVCQMKKKCRNVLQMWACIRLSESANTTVLENRFFRRASSFRLHCDCLAYEFDFLISTFAIYHDRNSWNYVITNNVNHKSKKLQSHTQNSHGQKFKTLLWNC